VPDASFYATTPRCCTSRFVMRKRTVTAASADAQPAAPGWLALEPLVQVEVTSEESGFPVEAALEPGGSAHASLAEWRLG